MSDYKEFEYQEKIGKLEKENKDLKESIITLSKMITGNIYNFEEVINSIEKHLKLITKEVK